MSSTNRVVVAAAIVASGRLLAARRTAPPDLAGLWELPGGKVEPGEGEREALVREIVEELGIEPQLSERVGGDWPLDHGVLRVWLASLAPGAEPRVHEPHDALRWLTWSELSDVPWLPADIEPAAAALRHVPGQPEC